MPSVYAPEDRSDELYDRHVQSLCDAFSEGQRAGRLGLGAGLCPQDYSEAERREWYRGHQQALAKYMTRAA